MPMSTKVLLEKTQNSIIHSESWLVTQRMAHGDGARAAVHCALCIHARRYILPVVFVFSLELKLQLKLWIWPCI